MASTDDQQRKRENISLDKNKDVIIIDSRSSSSSSYEMMITTTTGSNESGHQQRDEEEDEDEAEAVYEDPEAAAESEALDARYRKMATLLVILCLINTVIYIRLFTSLLLDGQKVKEKEGGLTSSEEGGGPSDKVSASNRTHKLIILELLRILQRFSPKGSPPPLTLITLSPSPSSCWPSSLNFLAWWPSSAAVASSSSSTASAWSSPSFPCSSSCCAAASASSSPPSSTSLPSGGRTTSWSVVAVVA